MIEKLIVNTTNIDKIKNLKPNIRGKFKQGYFNKDKLNKYEGPEPIIYRSSLEYKFIHWLERSNKVKTWTSEAGFTTYMYNGELHRYFIDFVFEDVDGDIFYIEIKPLKIVNENKHVPSSKNYKKWLAMRELCNEHKGHYFKIITDRFLP